MAALDKAPTFALLIQTHRTHNATKHTIDVIRLHLVETSCPSAVFTIALTWSKISLDSTTNDL